VSEIPDVAALGELLEGRGLRVQGLAPAGRGGRVVVYLNALTDGFAGFERREADYTSGGRQLRDVLAELLDGPSSQFDPPAPAQSDDVRDLLVCTHGRRDVCCGSLGTELATRLTTSAAVPAGVRPWRTSHTGGHRFAPTFIVLPEATAWAFADAELVDRVLRRRGAIADVVVHYRGCSGLTHPAVQALEREVLRRVGWSLFDCRRSGEFAPDGRTSLSVEQPDGDSVAWVAHVEAGRRLPVPDCGRPISEARKSETEWVVHDLVCHTGT
jgi:hypothetical protein